VFLDFCGYRKGPSDLKSFCSIHDETDRESETMHEESTCCESRHENLENALLVSQKMRGRLSSKKKVQEMT
jgi:hypothetical protein